MLDEPKSLAIRRGLVKYAYRTAAEVSGRITFMERQTFSGTFAGQVGSSDPYLLTQRPLVLFVPTKRGGGRWPVESLTVTPAGDVTARLGPLMQKG